MNIQKLDDPGAMVARQPRSGNAHAAVCGELGEEATQAHHGSATPNGAGRQF
jgi:hypothetical protein